MLKAAQARQRLDEDEELSDTWVVPLVQMGPLGIRVDEQVTQVSPPSGPLAPGCLLVNDKRPLAPIQGFPAVFLGNGCMK